VWITLVWFGALVVKMMTMAVWLSGNIIEPFSEVALRQAGLVLRWVTIRGYTVVVFNLDEYNSMPGHGVCYASA